ncbi:MAG: peptidyl-prolyl cis-trans isomerase [Deltaproteobacteria bacterium]|nr:peptidyl-prolyl cis-trans isomerase [Deltaproteobacteria bacterium]
MKKFFCLTVLLIGAACTPKPHSPVLATVNGEKITLEDFQKSMDATRWKFGSELGLSAERLKQLKTSAVESLLKDQLLLQEANRRGIEVSSSEVDKSVAQFKGYYSREEDFEKMLELKVMTSKDFREQRKKELRIKRLIDVVIAEQLSLTDEEIQKYYESHLSEFKHGEQVRARQIATDSREKAEALRKMLVDGTSFEEVAKKYSLSPDRMQGGNLGWFERGVMPGDFERVCFRLKPGELSAVIKSPYGYHLFEVLETRGAGQLPLDEVRESIRKKFLEINGREAFQKWYEALRAGAKIEVKTELLDEK